MAGDFNAKHSAWGNLNSNTRGNVLYDWWQMNTIERKIELYATSTPSYPKGNSFLDLLMIDDRIQVLNTDLTTR
ncbi:hypothetical protein, partial [Nocardia blacklockiae]|uniref:hypothetical protein n=1 Tax=Nocardia blacklockiae TaxID=480036 RepID=UPI001E41BB70